MAIKNDAPIIVKQSAEVPPDACAHMSLRPTVQAGFTLMAFNKDFGDLPIDILVQDLNKQCEMASRNDLGRAETLLVAQAHTLDAIFHQLARRAIKCNNSSQFEVNLRLGLKAQSQCRSTLEALSELKNPQRVAFVKQANIAHGPQQVNNGEVQGVGYYPAREAGNNNQQNKLSGGSDELSTNARASPLAGRVNQEMEAVGKVNRAKVKTR